MKLTYIRCNNKNICEKRKKEISTNAEVITKVVTSGKNILKKEIKELKEIIKNQNVEKLEVYYLNEKSKEILEKELGVKVVIMDEVKIKNPSKKLKFLFELLEILKKRDLKANDIIFNGYSKQSALNFLHELEEVFSPLVYSQNIKEGKVFKLRKGENIIREIFEKIDSLEYIQNLLNSLSEKDLRTLSKETKKFISEDKDLVIFKTRPFEKLNKYDNITFRELKKAVKEKRFIDIYGYQVAVDRVEGYEKEDYENVIPLKIVFMENNWYIAGVVNDKKHGKIVRFFRIGFIDDFVVKDKIPLNELKKEYFKFLEEFETPFTLYGKEWKKAILKIDSSKAFYFEKKNLFPKQKLLKKDDKGNLIIEVFYTQPMEILPNIKKWLPFVEIMESEDGSIEKELKKDLQNALKKIP